MASDKSESSLEAAGDNTEHRGQDTGAKIKEQDPEKQEAGKTERDEAFLIKFEENESLNPRNWSTRHKAFITLQLGLLAYVVPLSISRCLHTHTHGSLTGSIGSSLISPAAPIIAEEFGISQEVVVLTVALYVLGFALG